MNKYTMMIMANNRHEILQECLDALNAHTPFEYDIVLVDDASDPDFSAIDFKGRPHLIVRMPLRSNCCNLRNVGMEMSKTEFVFWIDSDAIVGPEWYAAMITKMDSDPQIGLVGQPKDARMVRKPFLPLTQKECMVEYQFAFDYNHVNDECDFIVSYCCLVRKQAYRPIYCYNMPTPMVDPELGIVVKANGYKVMVCETNFNCDHKGSSTPRPKGRNYLFYLSRNFTRWWNFWEPMKEKVFELYKKGSHVYDYNASEPMRNGQRGQLDEMDVDYDEIPEEFTYIDP